MTPANVTFLLKASKAISKSTTAVIDDNVGDVQLITLNEGSAVRACIFSGGTAVPTKLLHSDPEADAAAALGNLLKKTEKMLANFLMSGSKATSKRNKAVSCLSITTTSPDTKVPAANAEVYAPVNNVPVSKLTVFSKVKADSKVKVVSKVKVDSKVQTLAEAMVKLERVQSEPDMRFWDSSAINNCSFDMNDGPDDGNDSGFDSKDGELRLQRSYVPGIARARRAAAAAKRVGPGPVLGLLH